MIGWHFGNYVVERLLAAGGMGEVYVLRHVSLPDKYRVLKTILPEYASRADIRERFDREARSVAQLGDHPNIVGIDDYGMTHDGRLWMMMPFIDGQSLDAYLVAQGGTLPAYRILELLCDVSLGLDHAHQRGIIHRDIKPSNVFVSLSEGGAPSCKLLDFGIARQRQSAASTTQMALGTPSYMAVEQYEHAASADVPADIYALACMAWELESGAPPWSADDVAVLYHQKLHVAPPTPPGGKMSPEREAFLRSCLAVDPAYRPQSVRLFLQGYAATIPAPSQFVPSGIEVVQRRAPKLAGREPTEPTVRKIGPPAASTAPGTSKETTLGSANGAVTTAGPKTRSKVVALGIGAALAAGLGVYFAAIAGHTPTSSGEFVRPTSAPRPDPEATPPSASAEKPHASPPAATASAPTSSEPPKPSVDPTPAAVAPPAAAPPAAADKAPSGAASAPVTEVRRAPSLPAGAPATVRPDGRRPGPTSTPVKARPDVPASATKTKKKFDPDAMGGGDE